MCCGGRGLGRDGQGRRDVLNVVRFFELEVFEEGAPSLAHRSYVPDAIVVSCGANDHAVSGGAPPAHAEPITTCGALLTRFFMLYPGVLVLLTEGVILQGLEKAQMRELVRELEERTKPQCVQLVSAAHQPGDANDAHPTAPQHELMANEFEGSIRGELA